MHFTSRVPMPNLSDRTRFGRGLNWVHLDILNVVKLRCLLASQPQFLDTLLSMGHRGKVTGTLILSGVLDNGLPVLIGDILVIDLLPG